MNATSKAPTGPRHDPYYARDYDGFENLLLLCVTDNRRIDTQTGTFSADRLRQLKANHEVVVSSALAPHFRSSPSAENEPGFDNYRTEVHFEAGQSETALERFQQSIIADHRLRSYGKVATGFSGIAGSRTCAWIQAFLPVAEPLLQDIAKDAGVRVLGVRHELQARAYRGLIPS